MIRRLVDKISPLACVILLIGYAFAGLSPFHAPQNGAVWLNAEDGIRIRGEGVLWSELSFKSDSTIQSGCTIEILFQATNNFGSSTILDFYQTDPHREFVIRQDGNSLLQVVKSDSSGSQVLETKHQFFPGDRILLTVTSDASGANIYLNAAEAKTSGSLRLSRSDCAGQLILGSSAVTYNTWNGDLYGVAVHNSSLTSTEVREHFETWKTPVQMNRDKDENIAALYRFREHAGAKTRNEIAGGPDLTIPSRFQIPGRRFLDTPWNDRTRSIDWDDVIVNVFGFVPFGFFLNSFLSSRRRTRHSGFAAILIGLAVSLTIEVLQWYLPTRASSMTDVLTNTTGTMLGVAIYYFLFGASKERTS
jgi:hypothetical protein